MLSLLLFFLILAALPALCTVVSERKFEELLPIGCAVLVLASYVLGLLGLLHTVRIAALCMALYCYLAALLALRKKGNLCAALRRFFTPAFFLYLLLFFYLAALNHGRLVWEFDALSHWADVVKAMVQTGQLSTSPLAQSTFQSYPPGMSLFQYLAEELAILCGEAYADWRLYHAFQIFLLAFLLPFLRELSFRRISGWLLAAALFLAPTFLFEHVYSFIYVDPVLGILAGAGLAMLLLERQRDDGYLQLFVLCTAALLILIKGAGLLYAITLVLLYLLSELSGGTATIGQSLRAKGGSVLAALGALLLPWGSWKLKVALSGAAVAYPDKVSLIELLRVLSFQDQSYRKDVRDLFWTGLLENGSGAAISGVGLTYIVLFALLLTGFLFVLKRCSMRFPERERLFRWVFWLKLAELALYLLGLLVMYLFKFSAYEALQLASMQRYVAVPLLSIWLTTLLLAMALIQSSRGDRNLLAALLLCTALLTAPPQSLIRLSNREAVAQSIQNRAPITALEQSFAAHYDGPSARIYFLSQADTEYLLYMSKYSFRPHSVSSPLGWSLGGPFYEGDVWSRPCEAEALRQTLQSSFDFLVVYHMNEDFAQRFAALFADPSEIGESRIYAVDRDSGTLRLFAQG